MTIKINLPSIDEQKKIVKDMDVEISTKKLRTSFEFSEEINLFLEQEAERLNIPPSELFRRIIESADVDMTRHKRKLKNLTVYQSHMDKLATLADDMVPDAWKGKRGGNKSQVAEILINDYMKNKK